MEKSEPNDQNYIQFVYMQSPFVLFVCMKFIAYLLLQENFAAHWRF